MRFSLSLLAILISIFQTSCQNNKTVENQNLGIQNLNAVEFQKTLREKAGAQLIDVRTQKEFRERHLEGATLMNINEPEFNEMITTLDKNKPVFVYCLAGSRSSNAAERMKDAGFKEIYNLKGGIIAWSADNLPLVEAAGASSDKGMTMADLQAKVNSKSYVLVDYQAVWCGPCRKMAPTLQKFSEDHKEQLMLLKVDADDNARLLKEKGIQAIPYLEMYQNGKLIWQHTGLVTEDQLRQAAGFN